MGAYVVSPSTHRTPTGAYQASATVSTGQGLNTVRHVLRLDRLFASREAARILATTLGWLHTGSARPQTC